MTINRIFLSNSMSSIFSLEHNCRCSMHLLPIKLPIIILITSAKITLLLAVNVKPVDAAVIDNIATLTSGFS